MLYQLSYARVRKWVDNKPAAATGKPEFESLDCLAQCRANHFQEIIVFQRLLEKGDCARIRGALLGIRIIAARDDNDGNSFDRIQAMKPFHDAKSVPRHAADIRRKTQVQ